MNDVLQSLHERKSVRVFKDLKISENDKETILLAAMEAPTAGNQQLYTILDITEQSLKDKLAISCDNQPFIAKAPMVLIFCADFQKWYDAFVEGGCSPRLPGSYIQCGLITQCNVDGYTGKIISTYIFL